MRENEGMKKGQESHGVWNKTDVVKADSLIIHIRLDLACLSPSVFFLFVSQSSHLSLYFNFLTFSFPSLLPQATRFLAAADGAHVISLCLQEE